MSKKILGVVTTLVVVAAVLVGVGSVSAQSVSCANIDSVLSILGVTGASQIAAAKAALGCGSVAAPAYNFTRDLTVGSTGADVTALQNMLGVSPATGYFGSITKAAVVAYQTSKGIAPAAGYVGPLTRAALNYVAPVTTPTTPSTPAASSELEGTDGEITDVSSISTYSNEEVGQGASDVKVLGVDVDVSKDGDVALKSVKVKFTSTGSSQSTKLVDYVDSVSVMVGSEEVGSADASDFNKDSAGVYSKTISLSGAVALADKTTKVYVLVDALNNLDSSDIAGTDWDVELVNIRYTDGGGVTTTDTDSGDLASNGTKVAVNFVNFADAADTAIKVSVASDSPAAGVVMVDDQDVTEGVVLLKGKLKVEGDSDIWLDEMPITFTSTGADIDVVTGNVTLTIDGEDYSETVPTSATTTSVIVFNNLDIDISAGDTVNFTVSADIASTEEITNGDTLLASVTSDNMDNLVAEDEEGDQVADGVTSGAITGKAQSFYDEGVVINLSGTPSISKTTGIAGNSDVAVGTIKIKVEANGDTMYLAKVATAADGLPHVIAAGDATVSVVSISTTAEEDEAGTGYVIEEGTPEYFTFTVSMETTSTSLVNAEASITSLKWGSEDGTYDQTYNFNMKDFKSGATSIKKQS